MLRLQNADLAVDLLDPSSTATRRRQGLRYARGGYIWQIVDRRAGALLTGPEGPAPEPDAHNGHGLPESFRYKEFATGRPLTFGGSVGLILGVGTVATEERKEPVLIEEAAWRTERTDDCLGFATEQNAEGFHARIDRVVALHGRRVLSTSRLTNLGSRLLPLHWFAHPFFPLGCGRVRCRLPAGYSIAENPCYTLDAEGRLSQKRQFHGIYDGHFEPLLVPMHCGFSVELPHPLLSHVRFSTDFSPSFCPVWGNGHTWSIEPYLIQELPPGATRRWSLIYEFGEAAISRTRRK